MTTMTTEQPFRPDYAVPPGVTIAELLEEQGMTQTELAARLGVSLKHVNQIVNAAASISAELALGLEKVFGVPAAFWVNRESLYRADLARHDEERALEEAQDWAKRFPIRELKRRELLREDAKGPELVAELLRFLGIANPGIWSDPTVAYRRSKKFQSDPHALSAWLRVGELAAADIPCQPYNEDEFRKVLQWARSLARLKPSQ